MSDIPPAASPESNPTPPSDPAPSQNNSAPGTGDAAPGAATAADPADVEKNKVMAILAYVGILVLVPILAAKESPFAKYHANQGLVLTGAGILLSIVMVVASIIISFIPFVNAIAACFGFCFFPLVGLAWLAFSILGIINAVNGQMKPLPLFPNITIIK
jgi:uncharacterized membrane protein